MSHQYAYLHGFASSDQSHKGTELAERLARFGVRLRRPNINHPSFRKMTYSSIVDFLTEYDDEHAGRDETWRFVGSSMGGYLAARWAELHPERVDRLLLLCPGFALDDRWPDLLGDEAFHSWEEEGTFPFLDGAGKMQPVHWAFLEDARTHPDFPEVACPVRIIHGTRDPIVPIDSSRRYAAEHDNVELVEVDDEHSLTQSLDTIEEHIIDFFELN